MIFCYFVDEIFNCQWYWFFNILGEGNVYMYFVSVVNYLFYETNHPKQWLQTIPFYQLSEFCGWPGLVEWFCRSSLGSLVWLYSDGGWLACPPIFLWSLHVAYSRKLAGLLAWQLRTPTVPRGWKSALLVFWKARPDTGLAPLLLHPISGYSDRLPRSVKGLPESHEGGNTE